MPVGIAGTVGRDADGAIAEHSRGGDAEERAVDAAAIGDEDGSEGREPGVERRGLGRELSAIPLLNEALGGVRSGLRRGQRVQRRRGHSSQFSFSSASSSSSSSSSSSKSSPSSSDFSSSSSSSSSSERSSSIGDVLVT